MHTHHVRNDSGSSSALSDAHDRASPPPLSSTSDDSVYEGLAWYQIASVRRWKERGQPAAAQPQPHPPRREAHAPLPKSPSATPARAQTTPSPSARPPRRDREPASASPQHFVFSARPPPVLAPAHASPGRHSRASSSDADDGDEAAGVGARKGPWGCPVRGCPQVLRGRDPKTWLRHLDSHWSHVYKRYTCPRCRTDFSRPESVLRHAAGKPQCADVRTADVIEREACWLSPAYVRFLDPPPRAHPLFKVLQPVIDAARREDRIAHPPYAVLQPQIK